MTKLADINVTAIEPVEQDNQLLNQLPVDPPESSLATGYFLFCCGASASHFQGLGMVENGQLVKIFNRDWHAQKSPRHYDTLLPDWLDCTELYFNERFGKKAQLSDQPPLFVACSDGPGSFTGLRITLAAAKSWAWALDVPLLTFSAMEWMQSMFENRLLSETRDSQIEYLPSNSSTKGHNWDPRNNKITFLDARQKHVYTLADSSAKNALCIDVEPNVFLEKWYSENLQNSVAILADRPQAINDQLGQELVDKLAIRWFELDKTLSTADLGMFAFSNACRQLAGGANGWHLTHAGRLAHLLKSDVNYIRAAAKKV